MKAFVEIFLSSRPAEFYKRGINKQRDKWQALIQNNGKLIEINSLLHYL